MKSSFIKTTFLGMGLFLANAFCDGSVVFSDDFNTDSDGNLVGQNGWTQTGSTTTTPIQVSSGAVSVGGSGQDAYKALSSTVSAAAGTSFYVAADIVVTETHSADYFLHVVANGGDTSGFFDLLAVKGGTGSTFLFGIAPNTGATLAYGSTALSINTDYRIVLEYTFVNGGGAGSGNDQMTLYVNPTSSVEGNNSSYVTYTAANNGGTDPTSFGAINFRQGSSGPVETVDNLTAGSNFNDVVPVPELAAWGAISAAGLFSICGIRIWRQQRAPKIPV